MKNEGVISRIISAITGNKIAVRENLYYDTIKGTVDFALDDLINLRTAHALLNGVPFQAVIPAGTAMPVNYTETDIPGLDKYFQYKIYIPLNSTTNTPIGTPRIDAIFTDSTKVTLASINVYGNDDGSGNFNEDTTVTIY